MHAHVTEKLRAEKRRKRRGEEEKRRGEEEERRGGRGEKRREEEEKRRGRRQEEETRRREEERKKRRGEEEEEEEEKRRGRRKEDREEKAKEEEEEKKGKGTHPLHPFSQPHISYGVSRVPERGDAGRREVTHDTTGTASVISHRCLLPTPTSQAFFVPLVSDARSSHRAWD